jgi:hypothetical protein
MAQESGKRNRDEEKVKRNTKMKVHDHLYVLKVLTSVTEKRNIVPLKRNELRPLPVIFP